MSVVPRPILVQSSFLIHQGKLMFSGFLYLFEFSFTHLVWIYVYPIDSFSYPAPNKNNQDLTDFSLVTNSDPLTNNFNYFYFRCPDFTFIGSCFMHHVLCYSIMVQSVCLVLCSSRARQWPGCLRTCPEGLVSNLSLLTPSKCDKFRRKERNQGANKCNAKAKNSVKEDF